MASCAIEDCDRESFRRGWCGRHYQRWQRHGDPLAGGVYRDGRPRVCAIPGCEEPWRCREWCEPHYQRFIKYGDPLDDRTATRPTCSIVGCDELHIARSYCGKHYRKWKRYGDPLAASTPETRRKVPRRRLPEGYVINYKPEHPNARKDGRIFEHVVVMAEKLGRPLRPGENVHHVNGVRDDNRPENLELWRTMQPTGQRVADLIAFAKQVLSEYGADPTPYTPEGK